MDPRSAFERYIREAIDVVPDRLRQQIRNVAFVIEEDSRPTRKGEEEIDHAGTLLGLYQHSCPKS